MAESKMPARIWAVNSNSECVVSFTSESLAYRHAYIRADLVEPLVEALRASQAALTMMTAPKSIMATSTAQAYAHAYAAECKARAALSSYRSDQQ